MKIATLAIVAILSLSHNYSMAEEVIFFDDFSPQQDGWSFSSPTPGVFAELHPQINVSSVSLTVDAPLEDSDALLTFDLLMVRTLDGRFSCPGCGDTLTMEINGSLAFRGGWGNSFTSVKAAFDENPSGASFEPIAAGVPYNFYRITVPHAVNAGENTYVWSYSGLQPFADEAWGLDNVRLVAAIPEPTTAFLAAVGLLAFTLPRRRNVCC